MWPWKENSSAAGQTSMSVIDHGCEIEGHLTFGGTLILNGKFQGEVVSSDTLIAGVGQRMIGGIAKMMIDQFFKKMESFV